MKRINSIERFGTNGIVFVIALIVSSFVLINTIDIASKIAKEDKSNNKYSERIHYRLSYNSENELSKEENHKIVNKIISCLESLNCNASISGVGICVNNQIQDMFPDIVISAKNDYKLQLANNNGYASDPQQYQLVVGESMIELSKDHLGMSIDVAGMQVPIQGVFKNNNTAAIDYSFTFMYSLCDAKLKQYLYNQICDAFSSFGIIVSLYSDSSINSDNNKFINEMNSLSIQYQKQDEQQYKVSEYQNYWYRFYNKIFITVCLIFSLFTCLSTSFLWFTSRKKEIAIRKAFGHSNFSIFQLLIRDTLILTVPAVIIAMLIEIVYCLMLDNLSFFDRYFIIKFSGVFLGSCLIGVLCALNLMSEVSKISPISAIREEK